MDWTKHQYVHNVCYKSYVGKCNLNMFQLMQAHKRLYPSGALFHVIIWLTHCMHMHIHIHLEPNQTLQPPPSLCPHLNTPHPCPKYNTALPFFASSRMCTCYTPRTTKLLGGYTGFTPSVRPSVRLSVRPSVRPSRMPCPLCIIYSYGWILFILGTNDHYHERVCRAPWPLTLTYIFKVIWPWLRKWCPLCSIYSSGWILPIFGTNDHYH